MMMVMGWGRGRYRDPLTGLGFRGSRVADLVDFEMGPRNDAKRAAHLVRWGGVEPLAALRHTRVPRSQHLTDYGCPATRILRVIIV